MDNQPEVKKRENNPGQNGFGHYMGAGMAIGIGVGTAIGVAMDKIGMGIAIGVALGPTFALLMSACKNRK